MWTASTVSFLYDATTWIMCMLCMCPMQMCNTGKPSILISLANCCSFSWSLNTTRVARPALSSLLMSSVTSLYHSLYEPGNICQFLEDRHVVVPYIKSSKMAHFVFLSVIKKFISLCSLLVKNNIVKCSNNSCLHRQYVLKACFLSNAQQHTSRFIHSNAIYLSRGGWQHGLDPFPDWVPFLQRLTAGKFSFEILLHAGGRSVIHAMLMSRGHNNKINMQVVFICLVCCVPSSMLLLQSTL